MLRRRTTILYDLLRASTGRPQARSAGSYAAAAVFQERIADAEMFVAPLSGGNARLKPVLRTLAAIANDRGARAHLATASTVLVYGSNSKGSSSTAPKRLPTFVTYSPT